MVNKNNKKYFIYGGIFLAVLLLIFLVSTYNPPEGDEATVGGNSQIERPTFSGEKVLIENSQSSLEFEGYKIGGSHVGTFEDWEANIYLEEDKVSGIEGVAQVSSVKTDNEAVDKHLQKEDFFYTEMYPTIEFYSTEIDYENSQITGVLKFHGESKEITFPVELTDSSVSGEFYLDVSPFKFKFTGINPDVRIKFNFIY